MPLRLSNSDNPFKIYAIFLSHWVFFCKNDRFALKVLHNFYIWYSTMTEKDCTYMVWWFGGDFLAFDHLLTIMIVIIFSLNHSLILRILEAIVKDKGGIFEKHQTWTFTTPKPLFSRIFFWKSCAHFDRIANLYRAQRYGGPCMQTLSLLIPYFDGA